MSANSNTPLARLQSSLKNSNIDAVVLFRPANSQYASGFLAHTYSRPIIAVFSQDSETLIVPALERDNARKMSWISDVRDYAEFPVGGKVLESDPWTLVNEALSQGKYQRIGIEEDFLPVGVFNRLAAEHKTSQLVDAAALVTQHRMVKSEDELEVMRQAAKLADIGVGTTVNAAKAGMSEAEIDIVGTSAIAEEAARMFPDKLVDAQKALTASGPRTSDPHAASTTRRLESGDPFIHRRQVRIHGYGSESERTAFIDEIKDPRLIELYKVMFEAQQAAIDAIAPGVPLQEIDRIARGIISDAGYGEHFIHRTGHGLGLEPHEPPYFKEGETDPCKPGMVLSVEPGIYVEGIGGVRHSDSVAVTENGHEVLTHLPKDPM
jgi:Xaa-Pro dipeptidase